MFDLEVVRPSAEAIKQHGPSLNNILKLTQQAFNICHPEQSYSDTAKLGQCLDLIAFYYGFNSFGALKCFLDDTNADILPIQDTKAKVLHKLAQIYSLPINHDLIQAYYGSLTSYIHYSNLPDSINISIEGNYFNSLLAMRYLQIQPWDLVLKKLIKNPYYKLPNADIYDYSSIDRLIRVNILNNLLPLAKAAAHENKLSFTTPLSTFFGGQINKQIFLSEVAEFFNGKAIGSGLIEANGIQQLAIDDPMYPFMLSHGADERNIYSFEDADNVASMMISFKLMPRLQSMLIDYEPVKACAPIKIDIDLITANKSRGIQYAVGLEKASQKSANEILTDMISNLSHLNSVLSLPKAAWYQAEPLKSESQLAWRKYVIDYAETALPIMIRLANSILIDQRATLKRVYFDENGLLMFNLPKTIRLKPSSDYDLKEATNYEFSLFINFLFVAKHLNKLNLNAPERIHFRLMMNYLKSIYPTSLPDPYNQRAHIKELFESEKFTDIKAKALYIGIDTTTGKPSYIPINKGNNFIISGIPSLAPYHFFQIGLIENRVSSGQGMIYIDGSSNGNQLTILKSLLDKYDRQNDLLISNDIDFNIEQSIYSQQIVYIPLHTKLNQTQALDAINRLVIGINQFVLHNINSTPQFSIITNQAKSFILQDSWSRLYEKSFNSAFNIFHFCRNLNDLSEVLTANTTQKFMFWSGDEIMREQFSNFYQEPELLEQLPHFLESDCILLNWSNVVRYRYTPER